MLMVPLAITSTAGMIRRLGGRRWQMLHRLIYISAIAGVVHYYWLVKSDETVPLRFAVVVTVLLAYRDTGLRATEEHESAERQKRSQRIGRLRLSLICCGFTKFAARERPRRRIG